MDIGSRLKALPPWLTISASAFGGATVGYLETWATQNGVPTSWHQAQPALVGAAGAGLVALGHYLMDNGATREMRAKLARITAKEEDTIPPTTQDNSGVTR